MVILWGMLSMAGPVLVLTSGSLVAAAIVARDLSVMISPRRRIVMVTVGAIGYIASGGIGFAVDAHLRTPLISYAFVYAVMASSLIVGASLIRWMVVMTTKLTAFDQVRMQRERISS